VLGEKMEAKTMLMDCTFAFLMLANIRGMRKCPYVLINKSTAKR
jgi:hypothetical protein